MEGGGGGDFNCDGFGWKEEQVVAVSVLVWFEAAGCGRWAEMMVVVSGAKSGGGDVDVLVSNGRRHRK